MRLKITTVSVLLGLTLALAACGTNPGGAQWERPANPPETGPSTPVSASPAPAPGPATGSASALIEKSYKTFMAMPGYEAEMKYTQKGPKASSFGTYKLGGKPPRTLRINVVVGKSAGVKLFWQGGKTIKVRPAGFLGAVTVDLPVNDTRFKSVRGYTLEQTDLVAMFSYMRDPAHKSELQGADTAVVTGPKLLKGCVKMIVRFDPATALPRTVDMYDAKEVVYHVELTNFRVNKNVSLAI